MARGGKRTGAGRKPGPTARTQAKQRGRERALRNVDITAERVMLELARLAFTDRRGPWRDGHLKPLDEWTADEAACLEGFEVIVKNAQAGDGHTDTVHKAKLATKDNALNLLARHFGLVSDKLKLEGKVTLEQLIVASLDPPGP